MERSAERYQDLMNALVYSIDNPKDAHREY